MKLGISALLLFAILIPQRSFAIAMITECQSASGLAYDVKPQEHSWHEDRLDHTKVVFLRVGMREYNVIVKHGDRDEQIRAHDPSLRHVFEDDDNLTIVSLSPLGIAETFQLSTIKSNEKILFWNIMKNNVPPMKTTKVATYVLQCEDR